MAASVRFGCPLLVSTTLDQPTDRPEDRDCKTEVTPEAEAEAEAQAQAQAQEEVFCLLSCLQSTMALHAPHDDRNDMERKRHHTKFERITSSRVM